MWINGYVTSMGAIVVAALGTLDYQTGPEFSFSIFYLLPIMFTVWFAGRGCGLLVSLMAATSWLIADLLSNQTYSYVTAPYWNALVRLGSFVIIASLLSALRQLQKTMERTIQEKTRRLTAEITGRAHVQQLLDEMRAAGQRRTMNESREELCRSLKGIAHRAKALQESCEAMESLGSLQHQQAPSPGAQAAHLARLLNEAVDQASLLAEKTQCTESISPDATSLSR